MVTQWRKSCNKGPSLLLEGVNDFGFLTIKKWAPPLRIGQIWIPPPRTGQIWVPTSLNPYFRRLGLLYKYLNTMEINDIHIKMLYFHILECQK